MTREGFSIFIAFTFLSFFSCRTCSVNKISNLSDFEECPNLQELYLRKNNIQDINDLVYLQVSRQTSGCDLATGNVNVLCRGLGPTWKPKSHHTFAARDSSIRRRRAGFALWNSFIEFPRRLGPTAFLGQSNCFVSQSVVG